MYAPLSSARPYADRPLLDYLTGGRYVIREFKLRDLYPEAISEIKSIIATGAKGLSLASCTDEKLYLLWVYDYPGWLQFCKPLGIGIQQHPKLPKRLTTLTRQAGAHVIGDIPYAAVNARQFLTESELYQVRQLGFDESVCLDGGNVVSIELLTEMAKALGLNSASAQLFFQAGSYAQLRILTPDGMIKGDGLVSSRAAMGGYDVLYHPESICPEFSSQVCYAMVEPRTVVRRAAHECLDVGQPPILAPAWTDDQTMAWLGPWLWPPEHLQMALDDVIEATLGKLERGIPPTFVSRTTAVGDSLSDSIIRRAQSFEQKGLGIGASVYLTQAIGTGLLQHVDASQSRQVTKRRWPLLCGGHVPVATDAWLRMAGHNSNEWPNGAGYTELGTVWLHEDTQRLVYSNPDFAALYPRHGGWDLDDTVNALWRDIDGQKAIVMYRQPNTYGEYSVAAHPPNAFTPSWKSPTRGEITWPSLSSDMAPQYLEDLDTVETNPEAFEQEPFRPGNGYTPETAIAVFEDAIKSMGVLGRWVNVEMVYHATHGTARPRRVAATESVVDACTQQPTDAAISAILEDAAMQKRLLDQPGTVIDTRLWLERISSRIPPQFAKLDHTWWSELHDMHRQTLEASYKRLYSAAQFCRQRIPQIMMDLGQRFYKDGNNLVRFWFDQIGQIEAPDDQSRFSYLDELLAQQIDNCGDYAIDVTLAVVANVYRMPRRGGWSDTLLFGPQMLTRYLNAIEFYRLNELDAIWQGLSSCYACGRMWLSNSRVETQASRLGERHCGCQAPRIRPVR